ncbi:1512_t:CDS:1, partial [Funneliformis caledonium]
GKMPLLPWLHLTLFVCHLGGNNARSGFKKPWIKPPMDLELRFAKELEDDLKNGITDDFGLHELLLQIAIS